MFSNAEKVTSSYHMCFVFPRVQAPKMDPPARESVNSLHHSFHNHQRHRHHLSHHALIPISPMSVGVMSMLLVKSSCLLGSTMFDSTLSSIRWFATLPTILVFYNPRCCFSIISVFCCFIYTYPVLALYM